MDANGHEGAWGGGGGCRGAPGGVATDQTALASELTYEQTAPASGLAYGWATKAEDLGDFAGWAEYFVANGGGA